MVRGKHCGMMVHEIKKRPMKKVLENAWYVGRRRKLSIDINRLERHDNQLQYTSHLNEN